VSVSDVARGRVGVARLLPLAGGALALLGIALSLEHLLDAEHYNPGFDAFPVVTKLHVVLGGMYLALALPQLAPRVRARLPALHRRVGRAAAAAGVVAGVTALVMMALFPFAGHVTLLVAGPFAVLFVFALARGVQLARAGRIAEHREWMIRAFAIATAIATMRLLFVPLLFGLGEATDARARPLSVLSFGLAFAAHAAVAELWIRRSRTAPGSAPLALGPERPQRFGRRGSGRGARRDEGVDRCGADPLSSRK
jgi:uncharacterized membrane protein